MFGNIPKQQKKKKEKSVCYPSTSVCGSTTHDSNTRAKYLKQQKKSNKT